MDKRTIYNVADGLYTRTANGPFVNVESRGLSMKPEEKKIASRVEE